MVVLTLLTAAWFGKILHPLNGLAEAHIHGMGRPLQPQGGGLLPFPEEAVPDIDIADRAHGAEKDRHRQHQENDQPLLQGFDLQAA